MCGENARAVPWQELKLVQWSEKVMAQDRPMILSLGVAWTSLRLCGAVRALDAEALSDQQGQGRMSMRLLL